jgi:hypothetical protein
MPISGKKVFIKLKNRKMFCNNSNCQHKTFAESFSFIEKKAKKTNRLQEQIINFSMNLSSTNASKILSNSIATVSKSTICEFLKKDRNKSR